MSRRKDAKIADRIPTPVIVAFIAILGSIALAGSSAAQAPVALSGNACNSANTSLDDSTSSRSSLFGHASVTDWNLSNVTCVVHNEARSDHETHSHNEGVNVNDNLQHNAPHDSLVSFPHRGRATANSAVLEDAVTSGNGSAACDANAARLVDDGRASEWMLPTNDFLNNVTCQ